MNVEKWKKKKAIRFVLSFWYKLKYDRIDVYTAQASFYIIMSIAPIIMLLFTLLKFTPLTQEMVMETLGTILNENIMETVQGVVASIYNGASVTLISFATVSLLWVAGKGILGMMNGLNNIYGLWENRNYLRRRVAASLYTVLMVAAFILAVAILMFGFRFQSYLSELFPVLLKYRKELIYFQTLVALCLLAVIFDALYVFLPNRRKKFLTQLPGAVFTTLSWCVFSYFFSIYLGIAKNSSVIYGGLVTLVVSLLWLYSCMYLWFIGAELNAYLENKESFSNESLKESFPEESFSDEKT